MDFILAHFKHFAKLIVRKRVILRREREEIGAEATLFDVLCQHGSNLIASVFTCNKVPNFQRIEKLRTSLPISLHQGLSGGHDKVSCLFRRTSEHLTIINIMILAERARNHTCATILVNTSGRHVGYFEEHGANEMTRLQQVQVDVLMVGDLPSLLCLFLFGALVAESTSGDALREEFTDSARTNVREALVGIPDFAKAEGSQAKSYHSTVEQNHC
mmetsp:Transcript_20933/g.44167  ORF Transcript_20933/g.44167 Transcript_20933/m.44167 type:complete len:216 (+) Transcript_20933:479-1126(+)